MKSKQEIEKARVYLAGPFFSEKQIDLVKQVEDALEANPFVEAFFSPMRHQAEYLPYGSDAWRQVVFGQDVDHVRWANVVVAITDFDGEDTDSGTAFETGMAYALDTPVILVNVDKSRPVNLMLSDSAHAYLESVQELEEYNFIKMPKSRYNGGVI